MDGKLRRSAEIGATLAVGALAAAVAALPDVRRVAVGGASPGLVWIGLTGGTALVLGPLLVLVRAARSSASTARAALVGVAVAAGPVMILGEALKLHTHHRPLGAATFGFLSLAVAGGCVVVMLRLFAWSGAAAGHRSWVRRGAVLLAAASLGLIVLRAAASEAYGHDVVDALRVLIVAALAVRALESARFVALARRAGVPAWVLLVLLGLVAARGNVRDEIRERAPVLGGPAAWL